MIGDQIKKRRTDLDGGELTIDLTTAEKQRPSEIGALTQAISREEKKLECVREAYEAGIDTLDEYKVNKEKILSRIAELIKKKPAPGLTEAEQQERVRGRIRSGLGTLTRDDVSETTKNEVLRGFVERVILMKPKGNIEIRYKGDFL